MFAVSLEFKKLTWQINYWYEKKSTVMSKKCSMAYTVATKFWQCRTEEK